MNKKAYSPFCALILALGLLVVPAGAENVAVTMLAQGWQETLCAQLTGVEDADVAAVAYVDQTGVETALSGEDFTYLVRDVDGGVRIDIPGVKAGTYDLAVTLKNGKRYVAEDLEVRAYDRSGFAHKVHTWDAEGNITGMVDYTEGVGAYNDDGTLKENATVLYVTEETKNTVSLTQGFTVTGIGNILNCKGWDQNHQDPTRKLLKEMSAAHRPIVVRIIGTVTAPEGVTDKASKGNGGATKDNGGMCIMQYASNITIEGIGPDATVQGWGFCFDAGGTGRTILKNKNDRGKNFEVRNLTFREVPEDCIGIMGEQKTDKGVVVFDSSAEHSWVHNCAFYRPTVIPNPAESDKKQGDGAVDFRQGEYMTMSYNYFDSYHKTSLIGADDDNPQYHITWHHNWWKDVESRSPLCRQADVHIYNNLYDGQTSYCMSLRSNCFIFSEYNTFRNCKNPVVDEGSGGVCKSYRDVFETCNSQKPNAAQQVADKAETITSASLYANFDTDATLSYIPTGDYALQTDAAKAEETVRAEAGVMKSQLAVPGYCVVEWGTLGQMEWRYTDQGQLTLTDTLGQDEAVVVGCYDDQGRLLKVKILTATRRSVPLEADIPVVKLFWLDGGERPLSQAATVWDSK